ncbi:hypothetical protein [Streptomyces omiyaensis]|uniref:Uncharacterized protein n=1 Tax=Streptomyces omiyaensis TaxID=68247 RepID=A0ABW7C1Y8_9ACTN|nr:hypothetical protein [Streptomyces omiyaensis]GGY39321.1 hypothetical protein GCM10010363_20200 [Streptomyces omiyaensis]
MTDRWLYVSGAGVLRRGWTEAMVRELLGLPDVQGRDPRRYAPAPVRLYLLARVEAVERTPEFAAASAALARARRSAGAGLLAGRRRAAVLAAIRAEPIEVPRLPAAELERRAARHRHLLTARGPGGREAGPPAGPLARWQVGYLRQALVRYETLLDGLYGDVGRREAERLLRRRLYEAIAAAYPALAGECARRIARESA